MDQGGIHLVTLREDIDVADQILAAWPPLTVTYCGYLYLSDFTELPPDFGLKLAFVIDKYKAPVAFDCTQRPMILIKREFMDMFPRSAGIGLRQALKDRITWRRSIFGRHKVVRKAPGLYGLQDFRNAVMHEADVMGFDVMTLDF